MKNQSIFLHINIFHKSYFTLCVIIAYMEPKRFRTTNADNLKSNISVTFSPRLGSLNALTYNIYGKANTFVSMCMYTDFSVSPEGQQS